MKEENKITLEDGTILVKTAREAVTEYKALKEFGDLATLVWIRLKTGRTHQIRVHLDHIGYPIIILV